MQWTHLPQQLFFSEYEKTFLYCRTKIDISLHFASPPPSSSMTKFCLLKIVPKANPFFVTYCFSNAFLCQGEEAGFMKAMLWGGWVLFYCTHSICHKQSLSSCYHLFSSHFWQKVSWWWLHVSLMAFEAFYLFQKVQEIHSTSIWSKMVPSPTAPL